VPTIIGADKDLRNVVNFGWFGAIARPLFAYRFIGLRWFHEYTHNWGWAIVIQTFFITLLLLPLRIYQMRSALKMQKVQPHMKAIQENTRSTACATRASRRCRRKSESYTRLTCESGGRLSATSLSDALLHRYYKMPQRRH